MAALSARQLLMIAGALALAKGAYASVDLVTLPGRDATQLTIYNEVDLTLVREVRTLTLREGTNDIQFSWAGTLIDPTSVELRILPGGVPATIADVQYPANANQTAIFRATAPKGGSAQVEIRYFLSGVSWEASYALFADPGTATLRFEPDFTVRNASGEDIEDAQTRLVVGAVNMVEAIREIQLIPFSGALGGVAKLEQVKKVTLDDARPGTVSRGDVYRLKNGEGGGALQAAKDIAKAAISEYRLYTIAGTESIANGWAKQLPDPRIDGVPFKLSYEYNPRKYGNRPVKFYKFRNGAEEKLGKEAIPQGTFYVYASDGRGGQRFEGSTHHKYIPVGEDVELNLGVDGRLTFESRVVSVRRLNFDFDSDGNVRGHDVETMFEYEARNANDRAVPLKITLPQGVVDWEIADSTDPFKRVDRETLEFEVTVPAAGSKIIRYTHTLRIGSRDRTNK